ncbi:hypothetical protein ACTXT7_009105 [Hymenolepis weldensis]
MACEQPKISLKNLAGKSCITHHILPIFSCTNRFSTSFQELTESCGGTKAYFKRRGGNEEASFFFESKLAKFYEEGMLERTGIYQPDGGNHIFQYARGVFDATLKSLL